MHRGELDFDLNLSINVVTTFVQRGTFDLAEATLTAPRPKGEKHLFTPSFLLKKDYFVLVFFSIPMSTSLLPSALCCE